jgi:hypothetical protein
MRHLLVALTLLLLPVALFGQAGRSQPGRQRTTVRQHQAKRPMVNPCRKTMEPKAFNLALQNVHEQPNDPAKLVSAKHVGGSNCLTTGQVMDLVDQFHFEDSRLDFAKFAYDHVIDTRDYRRVAEKFRYSGSVQELDRYLQTR